MGDVKSTYREVRTELRKTVRGIDGTDLKDRVGNVGDEVSKDLGNLGDKVNKANREPKAETADSDSRVT